MTSWRTLLTARLATRPESSSLSSLSAALVLRELFDLLRWRFANGEEDLRRRRGFVVAFGILLDGLEARKCGQLTIADRSR